MRAYQQLCGLALALDQVGDRWKLLIVRDLILGPQRFGELKASLRGITPNLLAARLKDLTAAEVIEKQDPRGYALTERGRELVPAVFALSRWGAGRFDPGLAKTHRRRARWMMTSVLSRMQPLGIDWAVVVEVDGESFTAWERAGVVQVVDEAGPTVSEVWRPTLDELAGALFGGSRPANPGLAPFFRALDGSSAETR